MVVNKYACGITLYNPDSRVLERVKAYSFNFDVVYLFDNTEKINKGSEYLKLMDNVYQLANVIYISENDNKGLSYAFNTILDRLPDDIAYLCTLDQDSTFQEKDISKMKKTIENANNSYAIIAPKVIYRNEDVRRDESIIEKRYVITSGSFINVSIIKRENIRYDENYFIDKFEVDFEKQIQNLGYKIYQYNNSLLYQQLGDYNVRNHAVHSPLRHYYLFRNRFYFNQKFYTNFKKKILNILQTVRHATLIVLYENDKKKKLLVIKRAYKDYKNNIFGKIKPDHTVGENENEN